MMMMMMVVVMVVVGGDDDDYNDKAGDNNHDQYKYEHVRTSERALDYRYQSIVDLISSHPPKTWTNAWSGQVDCNRNENWCRYQIGLNFTAECCCIFHFITWLNTGPWWKGVFWLVLWAVRILLYRLLSKATSLDSHPRSDIRLIYLLFQLFLH